MVFLVKGTIRRITYEKNIFPFAHNTNVEYSLSSLFLIQNFISYVDFKFTTMVLSIRPIGYEVGLFFCM